MNPTDPYPVLLLLRAHLEGRMRQGERRLWLQPDATQALRELVRLKALHDRIESYGNPIFVGLGEMISEYARDKPIAWDKARALLARLGEGGEG